MKTCPAPSRPATAAAARRITHVMLCGLASLACIAHAAQATSPDGAAVVADAWARYRIDTRTETETVRVSIERAGQSAEGKALQPITRFDGDARKVLIRFLSPAADRGLGLLISREAADAATPSQMWLRMPSWSQGRRIAGDRESRYFGGTDMSFEDNRLLLGEAVQDFSYRVLRQDAQGSEIEASPRPGVISGYARRILHLGPGHAITAIDYLDTEGKPLKLQRHEGITQEPSGRWRATRIVVDNPREGRRSVFEIQLRQFNLPVADRMFTEAGLANE